VLTLALALGAGAFVAFDTVLAADSDSAGITHRGGRGGFRTDMPERDGTYLAEALGITTDELQAAYESAQAAALQQAVDDGWLTQKMADWLTERGLPGMRLFGFVDEAIDFDALLAEALGITPDELQAARDTAQAAALAAAVEAGDLTEEQAAIVAARQAMRAYLEKDEVIANALGISLEELQAAREEGQRIPDLLDELGLEQADFEANLQTTWEEALQQAVDNGAITQEQADLLLEQGFEGRMILDGHDSPGRGGRHGGMEGFPGQMP
jgi:lambda repressor-like predicted transcriptional regulator